jgi:hypothetical protein
MRFNKNIDIEFMAQPPSDTPKAKNTRKPTNLILRTGNPKDLTRIVNIVNSVKADWCASA